MALNEVYEEEVVDTDVTDSEVSCEEGRDWKETAAVVGLGALALDGAFHVGRFVYDKVLVPGFGKVKTFFQKKKEAKAETAATTPAETEKAQVVTK